MASSGKPHANSRLVSFLQRRILELKPRKTQAAIATEAGFRQHNMLTMIKSGTAKLPLDRVPALARALECDAALLFRMALEQLGEDTTEDAVAQIFRHVVTQNEASWLDAIRDASDNRDPPCTARSQRALRELLGK